MPTPGEYTVTVLATENYWTTPGQRVWGLNIQDKVVLTDFDLVAAAGAHAAVNLTYTVINVSTFVRLAFTPKVDQPLFGGVLVTPGATSGVPVVDSVGAPPPPAPAPGAPPGTPAMLQGSVVADLSINFGGQAFTDSLGNNWEPHNAYTTGCNPSGTQAPIEGSPADVLQMYRSECYGAFTVTLPVSTPGTYKLRFYNAETYWQQPNARVFDMQFNGVKLVKGWDVFAETAGVNKAAVREVTLPVSGSQLVIQMVDGVDNAILKGLQMTYKNNLTYPLELLPAQWDFQVVDPGDPKQNTYNFTGQAYLPVTITGTRIKLIQPDVYPLQPVFTFNVSGRHEPLDTAYSRTASYDNPMVLSPGSNFTINGIFTPADTRRYTAQLEFYAGVFLVGTILVSGTGDASANIPHILHAVIDGPKSTQITSTSIHGFYYYFVNTEGDNQQQVYFDGTPSHTHEPGAHVVSYLWTKSSDPNQATPAVIGTTVNVSAVLPVGSYTWNLTIFDDAPDLKNKSSFVSFTVYPPSAVPGALMLYYTKESLQLAALNNAHLQEDLDSYSPVAAIRQYNGFQLRAPLLASVKGVSFIARMKAFYTFTAEGMCKCFPPSCAVFAHQASMQCQSFGQELLLSYALWWHTVCKQQIKTNLSIHTLLLCLQVSTTSQLWEVQTVILLLSPCS